jgi:hypothetical protein
MQTVDLEFENALSESITFFADSDVRIVIPAAAARMMEECGRDGETRRLEDQPVVPAGCF